MKKKIFAALLASLMTVSAVSFGASAKTIDQSSTPKSANTDLLVNIEPTYLVTIPEDTTVSFGAASTAFGKVELTEAQLYPGYCVKVSATAGALENQSDTSYTLPYTIKAGDAEFTEGHYFKAGEGDDLTIDITAESWAAAYAGQYKGTVTFEIEHQPHTTAP